MVLGEQVRFSEVLVGDGLCHVEQVTDAQHIGNRESTYLKSIGCVNKRPNLMLGPILVPGPNLTLGPNLIAGPNLILGPKLIPGPNPILRPNLIPRPRFIPRPKLILGRRVGPGTRAGTRPVGGQ